MNELTTYPAALERALKLSETAGLNPLAAAGIATEIHADLIAGLMAEPAGPLRRTIRGYGTGLPLRPRNGLPRDDA